MRENTVNLSGKKSLRIFNRTLKALGEEVV